MVENDTDLIVISRSTTARIHLFPVHVLAAASPSDRRPWPAESADAAALGCCTRSLSLFDDVVVVEALRVRAACVVRGRVGGRGPPRVPRLHGEAKELREGRCSTRGRNGHR